MNACDRETFSTDVHRALHNLYNPVELKRSPLTKIFQIEQRSDIPSAIRHILTTAIRALKPDDKIPIDSQAWRLYYVLTYRFSEQTPQKEVASEMSLSIRQLRRLENQAITVVIDELWNKYCLSYQPDQEVTHQEPFQAGDDPAASNQLMPTSRQELDRLRTSLHRDTVIANDLLEGAIRTITPLLKRLNVGIDFEQPDHRVAVSGQLAALRHALIVLLTTAINIVPRGRIQVEVSEGLGKLSIQVRSDLESINSSYSLPDQESLDLITQLAELAGGSILFPAVSVPAVVFSAALLLPVPDQVSVLAIDDNSDVLRLFQRYLSGSHYQLHSVQDFQSAMAQVSEDPPQIIIVDVMLPDIDGWEILERFREHPLTQHIPVLVCTILPQEDLAQALGAAGFIRKPVNREDLLKALNQQADQLVKGSN